jgi:predicted ATPase
MITRIRAQNFRCLRSVDVPLQPFQILVGPNGSGKSALMDVLAFLRTLTTDNLDSALSERSPNFHDLVWGRESTSFIIGIEAAVPDSYRLAGVDLEFSRIIYEASVHADPKGDVVLLRGEKVALLHPETGTERPLALRDGTHARFFYQGVQQQGFPYEIHRRFSLLNHLPPDKKDLASAVWLGEFIKRDVHSVALETGKLRAPSPPYKAGTDGLTGAHLPGSVAELRDNSPHSYADWTKHLRTCLPDLEAVRTVVRPEDRHRYLMVRYKNGIEVPSWAVSDGTLRLMGLTVLAYLPTAGQMYLVEEPENGLHPTAIEAVYQSLSSVYDGQVLMASHSPILVGVAKPDELLCLARTRPGQRRLYAGKHTRACAIGRMR